MLNFIERGCIVMNITKQQKEAVIEVMGQETFELSDTELQIQIAQIMGEIPVISREVIESNGEVRIRATHDSDNNPWSFIRVEAPQKSGGWQNAHLHRHLTETWYVVKGTQVVMENENGSKKTMIIMNPGDVHTSRVDEEHNCYVSPGAVTLTIKTSPQSFAGDWIPASEEFDAYTKNINVCV